METDSNPVDHPKNTLLEWLMESAANGGAAQPPDLPTLRLILEKTLGDSRLSGSERNVLHEYIWSNSPDEVRLAVLRRAAFDMVSERLDAVNQRELLEWLHDIIELLIPHKHSAAYQEMHPQVLFSPKDPCAERICGLMKTAKASLDLCVFTITDNRLSDAILAAHAHGLKVRLITDDLKSDDIGSDIVRIAAAGVPVKTDDSPFHMHHKFAVIDAKIVVTGSYNWTRNAADENQENVLVTSDRRIVQPFSAEFERLWAQLNSL